MEIHFDVNKIQAIRIIDKSVTNIKWYDAEPEKRIFFGLIKYSSARTAGLKSMNYGYESSRKYYTDYTKEQLIKQGYLVIDNNVYHKPQLTIKFTHGDEIRENFNSYEEAVDYAEQVKSKSKLTFEIIKYGN